jgi:hypothetical protein
LLNDFEIWKLLEVTHKGIGQVKDFTLITLAREYELFNIKPNESIHEMHTKFITFVSELVSIGKKITNEEMVGKILRYLFRAWELKFIVIKKDKNLKVLDLNEFIRSLIDHEGKSKEVEVEDSDIKKKSLAAKLVNDNEDKHRYNGEDDDDDDEITMIVRKSTKLLRYKKYGGNK